ncbi:PA14 domain-containing protein [Ferruginibacter sp.]
MLTFLTGKKQKVIAWFLFLLFYTDMIGMAYASGRRFHALDPYVHTYTGSFKDRIYKGNNIVDPQSLIQVSLVDKKEKNVSGVTEIIAGQPMDNNAVIVKGDALLNDGEKPAIGGPGQPEMSTFKSIGADNMVNLFTGDFSYNIPLLDVDGYPINIFYNAQPSMDQEASWVGLGWNINPGTINRNMRGVPDDFNGSDKVTKEQSMKPEIVVGVNGATDKEVVGLPVAYAFDKNKKTLSAGVFYNSKRGVGLELGISGEFTAHKNIAAQACTEKHEDTTVYPINDFSLGAGVNLNSQTGLTHSVSFQKYLWNKDYTKNYGISTSIDFNSRTGLGDLRLEAERTKYLYTMKGSNDINSHSGSSLLSTNLSFARPSYTPSIRMPTTSFNATFSMKFGKESKGITKTYAIKGYYTRHGIDKDYQVQTKDAYGYMYYEKANNKREALLDFNRSNDGTYTYKTPVISLPVYTYDVFSISGEGTGGVFRGYRGNMGYVQDNYTRTNSGQVNLGIDLGIKDKVKAGATIGGVYSATVVGGWETENVLKQTAAFKESDKLVQSGFYFKNPGEKAIIDEDYYNNMGQDKLMRAMMGTSLNLTGPFLQPTTTLQSKFQLFNSSRQPDGTISITKDNSYRKERDKRTQVISYLTAEEADLIGLDRYIYSYQENFFKPGGCPTDYDPAYKSIIRRYNPNSDPNTPSYRKGHHISEITVQQDDKRYVYGLPVYELAQKEVNFSVGISKTVNESKGIVEYNKDVDNSSENKQGKDGMFQSETVDPYAHSFLLTAILSPDYSDLTGDGITDDDLGTAIKFNYTRVNKKSSLPNSWANMNWRLPVDEGYANFNRGLVTDNSDNKALYTYGQKELWYTHSIESKNMIATFTISDRQDGYGVKSYNGGVNDVNGAPCQKKLDRIDLYSKADFVKYGVNAKPIKTVHFTYTYKLCKNYALFSGNTANGNGKLTLESIYFTYNNNNHQKNKYRFKYAEEDNSNIVFNSLENDRWGTYKPHSQNPGSPAVSNEDYPYTTQNKTQSDANAATWSLNQILLPSGAKIDITYEADDYAYVQNKRAAQMTKILGFGASPTSTPENKLFTNATTHLPWDFDNMDYRYVFFDAPVTVSNNDDIKKYYLQDIKQLLFKLWVKVPKDSYGEGYEPMFVYCNIDAFGIVPGSNGSKFYIKVGKASHNNGSQVMETVYQFLRDQLPSKAYPGYDVGNKTAFGQVIKALFAMVNNIRTGVTGFENNARWDGWCKEYDAVRSVARLANPYFKKIGGGHRVKSVKITDNFKRMINPASNAPDISSTYGQEYDYTTTEMINGQPQVMSSGVASYEPGVGNEENPFREVLQYSATNPLGPTEISNIELPIAETFFPSPSVGYSRVTVKSIHNKTEKNIKSGVGMQETQFYTTRDFPTLTEFTDFDMLSRHHYKPNPISKIFNFAQKDYMTLSQGFKIVLNDMNGKMKMQASYPENDLKNPINKTTYFYRMNKVGENKYKLDNTVPVIGGADGKITNKLVGKDIEVMNDFREHFTFTHSAQIPLNLDFFTLANWPVLLPTVFRAVFRDESLYRSATTLKIVNEFGILDSVENIDKGSVVGTKNLVYDAETGEVLVSRTSNEFNAPIYNFSYPAYWAQEAMGPAYKNIDAEVKGLLFRNGRIEAGLSETEVNTIFESGDEIYVVDHANIGPKDNAACIAIGSGNACTLLPKSNEYRIWALDVTKDTRNTTKSFIFIDRNGNPYNAANADIRIVRSGRRNMMGASVGSVTSMASPIQLKPDNITYDKILINNNTNIVNTGAIEFKEKWKTQDAFFTQEDIQRVVRKAPILTSDVEFTQSAAYATFLKVKFLSSSRKYELYTNPDHFIAAQYNGGRNQPDYKHRSWLLFNFDAVSNLNASSNVVSAEINLPAHRNYHEIYVNGYYSGTNHSYFASHYSPANHPNDFVLSRMQSTWPSFSNEGLWRQLFNASAPAGTSNSQFVKGTPPPGFSNVDFKADITEVVKGMLKDKYDPAKGYATALMLSLATENIQGATVSRVCFQSTSPSSHEIERRTSIKLKYYNCSPDNPIVYQGPAANAPTNPPAGYMYCNTDEKVTGCYSVFSRQYMNPYVQGLLGNWRPLKSYVYNGQRREQDPTSTTTINKDGIIKDFETFWSLDATTNAEKKITRTNVNSTLWVSNSEISQYNRKGAELENFDPLNRYNAGIYGYNEALPVAVVNNSRLRLSAFDGFEDYFFKDQQCNLLCQPNKRHFETGVNTTQLSETQAHTGNYSFKTNANSNASINIKIAPDNLANEPDILIHPVVNQTNVPWVVPKGIGLNYYHFNSDGLSCTGIDQRVYIDYEQYNDPPCGFSYRGGNTFTWNGKIQVAESGQYQFKSDVPDDYATIVISKPGTFVTTVFDGCNNNTICANPHMTIVPINLVAGELYDVNITLQDRKHKSTINRGHVSFLWLDKCTNKWDFVPTANMYPTAADANGSIIAPNMICTKIDNIKAQSNYLIDGFSLIPGQRMIASVWVKKGETECNCADYTGFALKLKDANGNVLTGSQGSFVAKGNIIEGWQLMEAEFYVPEGAGMSLYIDNNSADALYIDDLRFHPYNANMKSFVYNPYNLKPLAELDENNYATFYEYDDDGTLIRVKKETRLGIKTIQETRSGLQKKITDF